VRNRERLLVAAAAVFAAGGPGASLEAVARKAGLGIGTLYRHFPTREALFQAVYRHEVDELADLAVRVGNEMEPLEGLRVWLRAVVGMVATKTGMIAALAPAFDPNADCVVDNITRVRASLSALMARAQAAGQVRQDIEAEDVFGAVFAFCQRREQPDWQERATRLVDVFVDGMTTGDGR